jgi:hypothetical protein
VEYKVRSCPIDWALYFFRKALLILPVDFRSQPAFRAGVSRITSNHHLVKISIELNRSLGKMKYIPDRFVLLRLFSHRLLFFVQISNPIFS